MSDGSIPLAFLTIAETMRIAVPTALDGVLGRIRRETVDRRLKSWATRLVQSAEIELDVRGAAPTDETFVIMSNHQSHFDVPVLYRVFPRSMRMVAKTELYRIPVFGSAIRAAEMVEVDRGDRERARRSIEEAKRRIASGINVWIAPEGTRSNSGELGTFKKGGFILALDTGARILPITIQGTREVLPPHQARVRRGQRVRVDFHAPIDPAAYGMDRRDDLVAAVRAAIASTL